MRSKPCTEHSRDSRKHEQETRKIHPVEGVFGYDGAAYRLLTHILTSGLVIPVWFLLRFLYRVEVRHRERLRHIKPPFLLVSNHQSLIDSYFLCILAGLRPEFLLRPRILPFHTPEEANFMASPLARLFHLSLRCIPIRRGKGIYQQGIETVIELLRRGNVVYMFPEGTRSRTGKMGKGAPGVGRVILESGTRVLPFHLDGMSDVLPIGSRFPRPFRRLRFSVGEMIPASAFSDLPNDSSGWRQASSRVMDAIRHLAEDTVE